MLEEITIIFQVVLLNDLKTKHFVFCDQNYLFPSTWNEDTKKSPIVSFALPLENYKLVYCIGPLAASS